MVCSAFAVVVDDSVGLLQRAVGAGRFDAVLEVDEARQRLADEELARRRAAKPVVVPTATRGYRKLFLQSVTQADQGVDFDFLMPPMTTKIPKA